MRPQGITFRCVLVALAFVSQANAQIFEPYAGEDTYFRFCAACHGAEGRGDGPVAQGIPVTVPDLTTLRERLGTEYRQDVLRRLIDGRDIVVYHGTRYMPVWGFEFWLEEGADREAEARVERIISNLLDYVDKLQRVPPAKQ